MAISSTPTPFKNTAQEEDSVAKNQTQSLLQKPVSPNVAVEKPKTQAQEILKEEKIVSPIDILRQEKISTPKDILGQTYFEKPESILAGEGITKAEDILRVEREREQSKKFASEQQMKMLQEEMSFQKQQQEYIKNIDPNNFKIPNQNVYDTKFGSIDFDKATVSQNSWAGTNTAVNFKVGNESYTYIPADYITKGVKNSNNTRYYFNEAFLQQSHWEKFLDKTQVIDISDFSGEANKYLKNKYNTDTASVGFLMKSSDVRELLPGNYMKSRALSGNMHGGEIQGLAYHPDLKKLVYVTQPRGKAQSSYLFYDDAKGTSVSRSHWMERSGFGNFVAGVLGNDITNLLTDFAQAFAQIPFGAEIGYAVTKNPAFYASLKALEVAGKGGNLENVAVAAVSSYAVTSVPINNISAQVTDYLYQGGQGAIGNELVAKAVGGALTHSAFNGILAAVQGQDIGEAMKIGAVGGGVSAVGPDLVNKAFGGEDKVIALSKQINVPPRQFQRVFTSAAVSGAVAAAQGGDFTKQFTNTLISEGVGTVAAGNVVKAMEQSGLSQQALNEIENNVRLVVSASARAAVRGEDIEQAFAAVARRELAIGVGKGLGTKLSDIAKYREQT